MKVPAASEFRVGTPPGEFSRWLLSLTPGKVYRVPPRFKGVPSRNVSGPNAAIRTAGRRAKFRMVFDTRYVLMERIEK